MAEALYFKNRSGVRVSGGTYERITLVNCPGAVIENVSLQFVPGPETLGSEAAIAILNSRDVTVSGVEIVGGLAVNGAPENATAQDESGNIVGRPCCRGIYAFRSQALTIVDTEVSVFDRCVVLNEVSQALLSRLNLHDRRRTAVAGAGLQDVTVERSLMTRSEPWAWGQTPYGDHADCLAFNTGAVPSHGVRILNNQMEQKSAPAILGMWLQGTEAAPFVEPEIVGNTIAVPNAQGIMLKHVKGGVVADNVLLWVDVPGISAKQRPTVRLNTGVDGVRISGNLLGAPVSDISQNQNPADGNLVNTQMALAPASAERGGTTDRALARTLAEIRAHAIASRTTRTVGPWDRVRAMAEEALGAA